MKPTLKVRAKALKTLNRSTSDKESGDGDGYWAEQSCDHYDG